MKVQRSNPIIQDRVNAVNALVEQRKIKVGNGCKHLIRTFEQHAYDEKGKPEKGGVGMDDLSHAGDAMGYAIYKLASIRMWKVGAASPARHRFGNGYSCLSVHGSTSCNPLSLL